jgi:hypothetical protein
MRCPQVVCAVQGFILAPYLAPRYRMHPFVALPAGPGAALN